jgi:3'(2'), 5'-bisphosphate nucleotidase
LADGPECAAGEQVMEVYRSDFEVRRKADTSPVAQADERAEISILQALAALTPWIAVICEEAASAGQVDGL